MIFFLLWIYEQTCSVSKNLRKRLYVWQKENPAWPGRTERKAGGGR